MEDAVIIRITGNVQGVGFRAFVKKNADDFSVNGFVRNEPDGSLYIEAQSADGKMLRRFVRACETGPREARIDTFVVEDSFPKPVFYFTIED